MKRQKLVCIRSVLPGQSFPPCLIPPHPPLPQNGGGGLQPHGDGGPHPPENSSLSGWKFHSAEVIIAWIDHKTMGNWKWTFWNWKHVLVSLRKCEILFWALQTEFYSKSFLNLFLTSTLSRKFRISHTNLKSKKFNLKKRKFSSKFNSIKLGLATNF